ncbi:hypothetical protein AQUCO_03500007v1 [Aquilegia coerulea]|uniref:Uncharacterized protein n=1 Tax=Aquilegia coerulea TaxID=218851 RepID=A0A2G5CVL5_AQUCA|nr:hypothetical protein AQUCO_03500007v1 [Aquilegia coerulea]
MMIIKTHEIICSFLAMLMLVLASHVSTTTAASPASVPRVNSMEDGISASLRKGIRGFFAKRRGGDAGSSFTTPIAGMDPKLMLQRSVPASGSSASSDNPANNNGSVGSVGVSLDHQKDSGGDHHSSSEQQHHEHEHDQKHNKDKKGSSSTTGGNNKGRKFKVCMTHNHCYKKKLVCPKKCGKKSSSPTPSSSSSRLLLIPNHFPGHNNHCVLNCKKCVAHC